MGHELFICDKTDANLQRDAFAPTIQALKAADVGIDDVSLRLLRVSVSGAELPLYYEFENRTTSELIVEIIKHASGRDAAFYFGGFFSAGLVTALLCLGLHVYVCVYARVCGVCL